jgi:hypothetical protein
MRNLRHLLIGTALLFFSAIMMTGCGGSNTYLMGGEVQGRTLNLSGITSTLAGTPGVVGSTDATGAVASFFVPSDIATDGRNLYVTDTFNNTIRKVVIATGVVTTLAGTAGVTGSADGTGPAASFNMPGSITTDGINLYVGDFYNSTVRKIVIATGAVTTLAGTAGVTGSTDATGPAASFDELEGITTDGMNLYVTDRNNSTIRKVVIATGAVTTLAGTAGNVGSTDATGSAASFNWPMGITTDGTKLYVSDSGNLTIREVLIATGAVTTLAGTAGVTGSTDATGPAASFNLLLGITTDGANLYVSDEGNGTIRKIVIATGAVTTLAGTPGKLGSTDGTGPAAQFYSPWGITTDGKRLYVVDSNYNPGPPIQSTGNNTIRSIQ